MLSLGIYIIGTLLVIVILHYWRNPKCNGKLPPGSMGWPLLGETIPFFAPNTSFDISPFVKERIRYGPIFRTSLVGRLVIVSTDPDFNYFIFQQEGKLFQSWYPYTFTEIFGRQNVGSLHGFMYKYLKNMVLNLFGPESLKICWSRQTSVEMKEASAKLISQMITRLLYNWKKTYFDYENSTENVSENFVAFIKGLISFPLYFPGTAYYKCLQVFRL
uniref:Cytochrome P450 n=1 Tax=Solanum lycopersicum TaxID=4081 RepID=A0A3Q7HI15_SOLLC